MTPLSICCTNFRKEGNRSLYSCYKIGPFPIGKGGTVANTIRRFLLSEVSGVAFSEVEFPGIPHEYSAIAGVRESPLEIMINLKAVVLSSGFKSEEPEYGFLEATGPAIVTARSLVLPPSVQCVDPDQPIATLAAKGVLRIKALISRGKGHDRDGFKWSSRAQLYDSEEVDSPHFWQGFQELDDVTKEELNEELSRDFKVWDDFTTGLKNVPEQLVFRLDPPLYPVQKVNSMVEVVESLSYRDGSLPEENVCLEIWTNGSVHPRVAIHEAGKEAVKLFHSFQHARYFHYLGERASQPELWLPKENALNGGQRGREGRSNRGAAGLNRNLEYKRRKQVPRRAERQAGANQLDFQERASRQTGSINRKLGYRWERLGNLKLVEKRMRLALLYICFALVEKRRRLALLYLCFLLFGFQKSRRKQKQR